MSLKPKIIAECSRQGLLRNQTAYVLATADHESNHTFEPVREAYWVNNAEAWRKANLRYYPWYGRGLVQLTWEPNYKRAGDAIGVNLIASPDLAMEPDNAVKIIVTGMKEGWFTGKKLSDFITLSTSNFTAARKIINGTDKAAEIAALAKKYDAELKASGYGEVDLKPIIPPPPNAPIPTHEAFPQPDVEPIDTPIPQPKSHKGLWLIGLIVVVVLVAAAIFTPIFKG